MSDAPHTHKTLILDHGLRFLGFHSCPSERQNPLHFEKDEYKNFVFTGRSSTSRVNEKPLLRVIFNQYHMLLALCKNIKSNFVSLDVTWKLSEMRISKAVYNITRFVNKMRNG